MRILMHTKATHVYGTRLYQTSLEESPLARSLSCNNNNNLVRNMVKPLGSLFKCILCLRMSLYFSPIQTELTCSCRPSETLNPFAKITLSEPQFTNGVYSCPTSLAAPSAQHYAPLPTPANSPDPLNQPSAHPSSSTMEF